MLLPTLAELDPERCWLGWTIEMASSRSEEDRNSADHGIEMPEARMAVGKPPEGTIRLRAFHRSGRVAIEGADDGAGIDPARVANRISTPKVHIRRGIALRFLNHCMTGFLLFSVECLSC
jgi:hypothetical protein